MAQVQVSKASALLGIVFLCVISGSAIVTPAIADPPDKEYEPRANYPPTGDNPYEQRRAALEAQKQLELSAQNPAADGANTTPVAPGNSYDPDALPAPPVVLTSPPPPPPRSPQNNPLPIFPTVQQQQAAAPAAPSAAETMLTAPLVQPGGANHPLPAEPPSAAALPTPLLSPEALAPMLPKPATPAVPSSASQAVLTEPPPAAVEQTALSPPPVAMPAPPRPPSASVQQSVRSTQKPSMVITARPAAQRAPIAAAPAPAVAAAQPASGDPSEQAFLERLVNRSDDTPPPMASAPPVAASAAPSVASAAVAPEAPASAAPPKVAMEVPGQPLPKGPYESMQPIINREVLHQNTLQPELAKSLTPDEMQALSPAAGNAPPAPVPVILPPVPTPADLPKDSPDITLNDLKPLLVAILSPSAGPTAAAIAASPSITPAAAAPAPAVTATAPPAALPKPLLPTAAPAPASAPTAAAPAPGIASAIPFSEDSSEPKRQLSPASQAIIEHIPSGIDDEKAPRPVPPIAVSHSGNPDMLLSQTGPNTVQETKHEGLGIDIQVKQPRLDMNYQLQQAYNAFIAGHNEDAIQIYRTILANDPGNKNALFGLATMYQRAGLISLARPLYAKLLAIDPQNRDGLNNFLVLLADEAPEAALAQLDMLQKRNPEFSPIPAQMAVIYEKQGNVDKATEYMLKAIDLEPENLTYRYNLAIILDKQHKYDEAARLYQQLIEAWQHGAVIPGNVQEIQQRLTFIGSNRP